MNESQHKLLRLFNLLSEEDGRSLLKFAAFLVHNAGVADEEVTNVLAEPCFIAAKKNESVVGALKRLAESYPMIDKATMLSEASDLMSQHVMQGRAKEDVIMELETLFLARYEKTRKESETQC